MKEIEKRMKLFFLGISESVMNFYLLGPNCFINLILLGGGGGLNPSFCLIAVKMENKI